MRALVTGGAGFIGHHLVRALLAQGDEVRVLDDFSTGQRSRLQPVEDRIGLIEGTIMDAPTLDAAMSDREVVFHQAAIPSVARSLVDPLTTHQVNVTGTIEVMLAASRSSVRRVVFAGSSSVYGIPSQLPCHERMLPAPESPYGVSKLAAEHYLHAMGRNLGVETVSLRYFNVFGPGQDPSSEYSAVIPLFITAVLEGRAPVINGDGGISRDFTYVDNVIAANLAAGEPGRPSGITCNVACGTRTTLSELVAGICEVVGRQVEPVLGPPRQGDIVHSQADISLAEELLGYRVRVPLHEGLRRTVGWFAGSLPGSPAA